MLGTILFTAEACGGDVLSDVGIIMRTGKNILYVMHTIRHK